MVIPFNSMLFLECWLSEKWDLTSGPLSKLLELLDTQVEGSIQWVLLEISWIYEIYVNSKQKYILTISDFVLCKTSVCVSDLRTSVTCTKKGGQYSLQVFTRENVYLRLLSGVEVWVPRKTRFVVGRGVSFNLVSLYNGGVPPMFGNFQEDQCFKLGRPYLYYTSWNLRFVCCLPWFFRSTGMVQEGMMPTLAMSIMEARGLRGTWKYKRPSRGNARRFTMWWPWRVLDETAVKGSKRGRSSDFLEMKCQNTASVMLFYKNQGHLLMG